MSALPLRVRCIPGSHFFSAVLVELSAAMNVASAIVPVLSVVPLP